MININNCVTIFTLLIISGPGIGYGNRQWNNRGGGGHRVHGGFGRRPGPGHTFIQHQYQNSEICSTPDFTDNASFEVEGCQGNNRNPNCQWGRYDRYRNAREGPYHLVNTYLAHGCCSFLNQKPRLRNSKYFVDLIAYEFSIFFWDNGRMPFRTPVQWKGTMVCRKGFATLKYTSTCSEGGLWNPEFPDSCTKLIELQGFLPSNSQEVSVPSGKLDCMEFRVRLTENFMLSCVLPDSNQEVENCFTHRNSVPSGTKLILKCKLPYRSSTGHYPEWLCEDGNWPSVSNKLLCIYSSYNGHPIEGGNRGENDNTEKPNYHEPKPDSQPNRTPYPKINVTTTPETNTWGAQPPNPWRNHQSNQWSTQQPNLWTSPTTTVSPGWQIPSIATVTPQPSFIVTSPSTIIQERMCPALTHKAPGVRLECVAVGQGVSTTRCDAPMRKGSEAKYFCDDYYESTFGLKTLFRKCKEDGSWTGSADSFRCVPQCGRANVVRVPYITNGLPTVRGQWPWHAAIFLQSEKSTIWSFICGATLLSKRAILTAAHCVTLFQTTETREKHRFRIDLGKYERELNDDLVQERNVQDFFVNPAYNPYGYDSDIAIIILNRDIEIGYHVRPICFPQTSDTALEELQLAENSIGTVVGWGYDENRELATALRMAKLKVIGRRECSQTASGGSSGQIHTRSTTYCAGFQNGTNVCNGDSGGGMYFSSKEASDEITRWYLQGIVSVGISDESGKCDPRQFSVFTRVGRYSDWITKILTENDAI